VPAPDEVEVRPAAPEDLAAVLEIYNHYVTRSAATFETVPVTPEERREWFEVHRGPGPHRLFVAVDREGGLLGWATTSPFRPRAAYATTVESSVYCHPHHLGQGIGRRLYTTLFRSVEDQDIERIVAGVALPNPASIALHQAFGFRPVGTFTRVGRKFGKYWDVEWLERPARLATPHSVEMPERM
jgi:phosphinothricin acetyltransferase